MQLLYDDSWTFKHINWPQHLIMTTCNRLTIIYSYKLMLDLLLYLIVSINLYYTCIDKEMDWLDSQVRQDGKSKSLS